MSNKIMYKVLVGFLITGNTFAQHSLVTSGGDFKSLFNNHRVGQPKLIPWAGDFFPYSSNGTAIKLDKNGNEDKRGISPMENYGKVMRLGMAAHNWEKENHSCDQYDKETKKSCEAWWGHCNGWAAAAIKEKEPRKDITIDGTNLTVADQKGILSELWLASYSLNTGETDKSTKIGKWVHNHTSEESNIAYKSFWDISPKTFFMVFTHHVGVMKTGLVIDRHTGDEVWNQPIVGYRFMPILKQNIKEIKDRGERYWAVKMGVKLFWANDLGTPPGHISRPFDIFKMTKDESGIRPVVGDVEHLGSDYEGRYLEFTLYFDDEVTISDDGKTVERAGQIIGNGLWEHQENSRKYSLEDLKHSHPDFIWLPTNPYQDQSGYGNPYLDMKISRMISSESGESSGNGAGAGNLEGPVLLKLSFNANDFNVRVLNDDSVKRAIKKILLRDNLKSRITSDGVEFRGSRVIVKIEFTAVDVNYLSELFKTANLPFRVLR